ncbi:uncharacterized protein [Temnothorax nylanderi]|uniref:uncharacterized protein n=1 Tax=Temnothorax nylanderi TaxID=102681 RepID=UPI003A849078
MFFSALLYVHASTINVFVLSLTAIIVWKMSQMYSKKTRTARASQVQLTKMVDYFYLHKGLAEGKFHALHGKKEAQKKWTQLANELNCFQGATKTVEQWQVVWRDLKSRTSIKAKDLRKAKGLTGNKAIAQPELTELELRVIGIIGAEYVEGNKDCADSIPDEEDLIEELERGNNSVLSATPQVLSVCTNMSETSQHSQYLNANFLDNNEDVMTVDDDCPQNTDFVFDNARNEIRDSDATQNLANCASRKIAIPKTATIPSSRSRNSPYSLPASKLAEHSGSSSRNIHAPTSSRTFNSLDSNNEDVIITLNDDCSQDTDFDNARNEIGNSDATQNLANCARKVTIPKTATIPSFRTRNRASNSAEHSNSSSKNIQAPISSRRFNRVTPEQLSSSREVFQSVAQKQANAEFMHAEAAKVQAEASKMNALAITEIAQAIQKLADTAAVQAVNDSEQIRIFEKLTIILENMVPTYVNDQSL